MERNGGPVPPSRERFGCSRYVDPSPGLTGLAGQYHQAASLVAVPDGRITGTTTGSFLWSQVKNDLKVFTN